MTVAIVSLAPAQTWPLRRSVLRAGNPSAQVVFEGDDDASTMHFGAFDEHGSVVAVSTWIRRPVPGGDPGIEAFQLRAMAISPTLQGSGIGSQVLGHGLEQAARAGGAVVWANARDTAIAFYRRHGFDVVGEGFIDEETSIGHHLVVRPLVPFHAPGDTHAG